MTSSTTNHIFWTDLHFYHLNTYTQKSLILQR
jgi:hypothetical protein